MIHDLSSSQYNKSGLKAKEEKFYDAFIKIRLSKTDSVKQIPYNRLSKTDSV